MDEPRIYCTSCGCLVDIEDVLYMDDQPYCEECLEELTIFCEECGRRIFVSENFGDANTPLCEHCCDYYYIRCDECGRLISRNDAYYEDDDDEEVALCENCTHTGVIYNYSYKPAPIFYGEDSEMFLGVELEIDEGYENKRCAQELNDIANRDATRIYLKHDGSLNNGFEIVSHPMTLEYHRTKMPWRELLAQAISEGYQSHKTDTCGLHCHVNRNAFGESEQEQEENTGKVLFLVEKYWEELLRFSRRSEYQMGRWAARYGFKERPNQVMEQAKKSSLGRYACINLTNRNTVEFRMWRGTLKYNSFIAILQMVERLCRVAILFSEEELQKLSWWGFVGRIEEEELITYLKERQLYVNEPVEGMEEEE